MIRLAVALAAAAALLPTPAWAGTTDGPRVAAAAADPSLTRPAKPTALQRSSAARTLLHARSAGTVDRIPATPRVATQACAVGHFGYVNNYGEPESGPGWRIEAWDRDSAPGDADDDLLSVGWTDRDGSYRICFPNSDEGTAGVDLYIKFIADNGSWRVQDNAGQVYTFRTPVDGEVVTNSTVDFGDTQPDEGLQGVGQIFDAVYATWNALPGDCWDMIDDCRPVVVQWGPDSFNGLSYYDGGSDTVYLSRTSITNFTIVHEVGHAIMDDVYQDADLSRPNCNPHDFFRASSAGCAWVEGFADWLPGWVYGPLPDDHRLETYTGTRFQSGDTVEGRVAAALTDLADAHNEGSDGVTEGIGAIWDTFQRHNDNTFAQFWAHRGEDGHDVGTASLAVLLQNTIDYR